MTAKGCHPGHHNCHGKSSGLADEADRWLGKPVSE